MKRTTRTIITLASVLPVLAAGSAAAQRTDTPTASDTYNAEMRNEWVAVGLEAALPTLGHAYAGDWKRGILPAAVALGGYGVAAVAYDGCDGPKMDECSDGQATQIVLGVLAGFGGQVWSLVSAYDTARDRNRALRERLGIDATMAVRPAADGRFEFGITLRAR